LINVIKARLATHWFYWVRLRAKKNVLNSQSIYIIPSLFGFAYAFVLLTLFFCAINYQVSSVFFLTFLFAMLGIVSAVDAHTNLKGLRVICLSISDSYPHGMVNIKLRLSTPNPHVYALYGSFDREDERMIGNIKYKGAEMTFSLRANARGYYDVPRFNLKSYFPLGLFRAWGYIYFDDKYYVYPSPISPGFWPKSLGDEGHQGAHVDGHEELYELKSVIDPWAHPGRIAWKIAARGQGWFVKKLMGPEGESRVFCLEDLPIRDIELNLQHLSYWLHESERNGYCYGLELKGIQTKLSKGQTHLAQCLRELALY
jgi:uncharacterized protein (DUF58 family)